MKPLYNFVRNIQRKDAKTQRNRPFLPCKNTSLKSSLTKRGAALEQFYLAPLCVKELLRLVTLSFAQRGRFCSAERLIDHKAFILAKPLCVFASLRFSFFALASEANYAEVST